MAEEAPSVPSPSPPPPAIDAPSPEAKTPAPPISPRVQPSPRSPGRASLGGAGGRKSSSFIEAEDGAASYDPPSQRRRSYMVTLGAKGHEPLVPEERVACKVHSYLGPQALSTIGTRGLKWGKAGNQDAKPPSGIQNPTSLDLLQAERIRKEWVVQHGAGLAISPGSPRPGADMWARRPTEEEPGAVFPYVMMRDEEERWMRANARAVQDFAVKERHHRRSFAPQQEATAKSRAPLSARTPTALQPPQPQPPLTARPTQSRVPPISPRHQPTPKLSSSRRTGGSGARAGTEEHCYGMPSRALDATNETAGSLLTDSEYIRMKHRMRELRRAVRDEEQLRRHAERSLSSARKNISHPARPTRLPQDAALAATSSHLAGVSIDPIGHRPSDRIAVR